MTKGNHLGDAYATTLTRMKAQKGSRSRLGMEALMWVSNSQRPLQTTELCHALGVKIESPILDVENIPTIRPLSDLDVENIPTIRTLLACSLGLITVEASSSTVRLVHFTLKEYLSDNPSLFQSPHSMIAEVCLTYLNFRCVRELSPTLSSALPALPLVGYASIYWAKHIGMEKRECVSPLALGLLLQFEQHISSHLLLLQYNQDSQFWESDFDKKGVPRGFTGLHGAAFFGIVEIFVALLAIKEWDVNATDSFGRTALAWAALRGHEDIVGMLLRQKDAKANIANIGDGRTPLWWAAERGHAGVLKLLLERDDVNPNSFMTEHEQTLLGWAARKGHGRVVKLLLEREDTNPNIADTQCGLTPLWWAVVKKHEEIVKMILEREDVDRGIPDLSDENIIQLLIFFQCTIILHLLPATIYCPRSPLLMSRYGVCPLSAMLTLITAYTLKPLFDFLFTKPEFYMIWLQYCEYRNNCGWRLDVYILLLLIKGRIL